MRKSVKRGIVVGIALAVTVGTGAAWAAWTAYGTGNVYAKADTVVPLELVAATADATLYPGATGDAIIKVKNSNKFPVAVTNVTWKPSDGVRATGGIGFCSNTGVYFGDFSTGPVGSNGMLAGARLMAAAGGQLKIGGGETVQFTLANAVRMINNVDNGCQGATFSIPVSVIGSSEAS
ncbi:hypothetical protein [Jidongwangia harbinensis]|uniref:hypothetical protein n=1 Tax=Jidongwangia harbinensis TaxID=2878561 RepID=UPI001CD92700|nr:hypothetical protein [Jidongwangia harbinensis]MCA2213040.1 hypothetical protein [Jidongwangia harbinensis]